MLCSLQDNHIGDEGASALAAVLKETKITTLGCAAAPYCSISCQSPLTLISTCLLTALAVWSATTSVPKEEPRSLQGSRATQRCKCSSKPTGTRTGPWALDFLSAPH